MARPACAPGQLAHHLHPHETLVQVGRARACLHRAAASANRAHQARSRLAGRYQREGASRWHGRAKKNGPQAIGKSRGGRTTKIHLVAANDRTVVIFALSPGQAHDAPQGRALLRQLGAIEGPVHLLMDRAYEGNATRQLARDLGFIAVVPPLKTRLDPWEYDKEMYKRRNEVERLFRRLKGFRRVFTRYDKLDVMFIGFITFALIVDALRLC
ncbi:IS5 family transposase [Polaromonas sp.]|uniref:IS5 family transposase n=1 Tax=Polaromonas sp. TaxID=1869339 RepID=UPI003BB76962